jgi:tRNA(Ile)-lysidine synthase
MLHPFETRLAESWPPSAWADVTVLVAVSGGTDSVALLRAMAALKTGGDGRLYAAHLNHRLRPEADDDERFVVDLCGRLKVTCEVGRADVMQSATGDGVEAAARAARYRFLEETAGRLGARFVATAHTADDQAETVLQRILRGTGIRGLSGMGRARPLGHAVLIRPMLEIRRAELAAYLEALGQPFCHDRSNADPRFTRNRIRNQLLPRLQKYFNPEVVESLLRLGALAGEAQAVIDADVDACFDRCVAIDASGEVRIEIESLAVRPRYLIRELLMAVWRRMGWPMQSMGMVKWDELCGLATLTASTAKQVFPGGVVVEVAGGEMRLTRFAGK